MGKVFIKNVNICVRGRGYRIRTEHEMGIVDVKKTYTLPGLLKNRENVRVGDSVVLPEVTVPETTIAGKDTMRFDTQIIKDTATVYDIRDGKLYLLFNHGLFRSAADNNNTKEWEDTQLCNYLNLSLMPAMARAGIPATEVSLLSKDEVFGENPIPFFRNGKNRAAFDKDEDFSIWCWLKTPYGKESSAGFYGIDSLGADDYEYAGKATGFVRPRFVL